MIVYFADGPLNGQLREIGGATWRYRVPIMPDPVKDWGPGYWEGNEAGFAYDFKHIPPPRVGYYEPSVATLKTGAQIWVFQGFE